MTKRVVLAYSGGLDTSYCALYLSKELGYEVIAVTINTGGFSTEELEQIGDRALKAGVAKYEVLEETQRYYDKVVQYLLFGNVLKNQTYPLSVSAERIAQASALAAYAKKVNAAAVAHGSTGAGNDQIRFDMILQNLLPGIELITPIRDKQLSREEEINYLHQAGLDFPSSKATYSINQGLWGTSVGGKETLNSRQNLPESAWPIQVSKSEPETVQIRFEKGQPVSVNNIRFAHPIQVIKALHRIASPFGIGRDIHVGDTILGIKGRVGFEAAAPLILIKAHHLLEKHVLTKSQLAWKEQIAQFYGNNLHEGLYLDPVMRNMEAFLESSQEKVSGNVFIKLYPYRFELEGIESEHDLMSSKFGTYGEMNRAWSAEDAKGFIRIYGNQNTMYYQINKEENPYHEYN
ncbi:MAG: argininosuccinate synthase [Bacteroidetes bacterium]|nr:MAG: argininosuccinate synthase [Bacteroidota bacterium]